MGIGDEVTVKRGTYEGLSGVVTAFHGAVGCQEAEIKLDDGGQYVNVPVEDL